MTNQNKNFHLEEENIKDFQKEGITEEKSDVLSIEQIKKSNSNYERSYHLNVVIKLGFMAAMGGFLFGLF